MQDFAHMHHKQCYNKDRFISWLKTNQKALSTGECGYLVQEVVTGHMVALAQLIVGHKNPKHWKES